MEAELQVLQEEDGRRTAAIEASHEGGWPCRKVCGFCCTRLASVPLQTKPEWDRLQTGLAALNEPTRQQIEVRIASLSSAPFVCPFLDRESQSCLVHEHRPIARRTYGFYVERDMGLYCGDILKLVESGAAREVVWGNAAGVGEKLDRMGTRRGLKALAKMDPVPGKPLEFDCPTAEECAYETAIERLSQSGP